LPSWPRRSRGGHRLERAEGVTNTHAEFGLDSRLGGTWRVGRHIGLQLSQAQPRRRCRPGPAEAQHLAKLNPGPAELAQGSTEPLPRSQGSEIRIRNPGNKRGAKSGVGSGCGVVGQLSEPVPGEGVVGQLSEPVPGEDVSNLLDAIPVTEEHTSNVV
jgi:hypothetical protein